MLPSSDPPSPSSKKRTAPRRAAPVLPLPEQEKKPDKKLETPVLVAMISAVVTLVAAILGSPTLLSLVNKANAPAPTSAVVLVASPSLLPATPSAGELFEATFTPAHSGTDNIVFTSTPPGENPTSAPPLLESAFTSTVLPPQKPDPPTPPAPSFFQCLAADLWFPYPDTLNPGISHGCWDLAEWGFSTDQGRLLLVHNPNQDQQRGIYTPISGDVDIRFTLQLDEFRTRSNKVAFLNFGVVENDPFSIYTGGYLSYQQTAPGAASPVRVLVSGTNQATQKISLLEVGFQHQVLLSIQKDLLVVYLDGEQAGNPVKLPHTGRAFWIGYVLPSNSQLKVVLADFTIQAR
jgi:hypothetical protein